ncbi:hypothetical protein KC946_01665 [Candidatus Saccharibacteria bacterium]|nr:hypothetical protein [Candidatus Saccharibacteria bacterium]
MSIESELETFRDLALEEQIKIPYYLANYDSYELVYENLDPVLDEIVGDHKVVGTGEIFVPEIAEDGSYLQALKLPDHRQPLIGNNEGVRIGKRSELDPLDTDRYIIAYWIGITTVNRVSILEQTKTHYYGFAPIESSNLMVPDLILPEETILPDPDDPVASRIDENVLNEPPNLGHLTSIFQSIENQSDLLIDYYLGYLNTIFPLIDYQAKISCSRLLQLEDEIYFDMLDMNSNYNGVIGPKNFEFHPNIGGLAITMNATTDEYGDYKKYIFPIVDINSLSFTHHRK